MSGTDSRETSPAGGRILVTGAAGFIGSRVVANLLARGLGPVRCLARPGGRRLASAGSAAAEPVEVVTGNLLSRTDCERAVRGVRVVYHLAAGKGEKSFPDAFANSVVTTRNLLEACAAAGTVRRFVNISSFSVYSNRGNPRRGVLDEDCPALDRPASRGEAYTYAKTKQDEMVRELGARLGIPVVFVRPGYVYGPGGGTAISGRIGLGSFGVFLHLGGGNPVPLTYVDNCAEAIVLAGLAPGVEGEAFNIVDDDLPSSRRFLRLYKRSVRRFRSIYLPHAASYLLAWAWESYAERSGGQLPPVYNRALWHAFWKKTRYTNAKAKRMLGWQPAVATEEGLRRFFAACRQERAIA